MKKLKCIIFSFLLFLSVGFLPTFSAFYHPQESASAMALDSLVFDYISLTESGNVLNENAFRTVVENDIATSYIVTNSAITINFKPFTYSYTNVNVKNQENLNHDKFEASTVSYSFTKTDRFGGSLENNEFEFFGTTYYVDTNANIYDENPLSAAISPLINANTSDLFNVESTTNTLTISITYAYTFKISNEYDSATFSFNIGNNNQANSVVLEFVKPSMNFANGKKNIAEFDAFYEETHEISNFLQSENIYEKIDFKILNNNYTEVNPLFFEVNYNGFIYNFELYSKFVGREELLFVEYKDENLTSNNKSLATFVASDGVVETKVYKLAENGASNIPNYFKLSFEEIGRYELKIYDTTYTSGMRNANYYSTSFYIKEKIETEENALNNIYMVAQATSNEDDNELEYIVNGSTQNRNVILTIKNLQNSYEDFKLDEIISKIAVSKNIFTGSNVIPDTTQQYSASEIMQHLETTGDGDFILPEFTDDARYVIRIYDTSGKEIESKTYVFTVVKEAKTGFTPDGIDEETGRPYGYHTASQDYYTETLSYTNNINSKLTISINVECLIWDDKSTSYNQSSETASLLLQKSYVNNFKISYAVDRVNIVITELNDDITALQVVFMGVGNIEAYVTFNGETTKYDLNYENGNATLYFYEYGTYEFKMEDAMHTTQTKPYEYKQSINVSTIVLIVLSSIIVITITVFVLKARGNVKTR